MGNFRLRQSTPGFVSLEGFSLGFVNNQAQMDRAIEIARTVEGVAKVTNEMSLKK